MSVAIPHIKPEDIDTPEKRAKYTITIVGCEPIGVAQAYLFAEAGFKVICTDTNQAVANLLSKGKTAFLKREAETKLRSHLKTAHLSVTNDIKTAVSQSHIIAITNTVKIDGKKKTDYSEIEKTCKTIGSSLHRGSIVTVMSTTGIGFLESVLKEVLENSSGYKSGVDFGLAYSPIKTQTVKTLEDLANCERIVAATDKTSLGSVAALITTVSTKKTKQTSNMKTAEAATLFEITHEDVEAALANELALFCERIGVDYAEIQELAGNARLGSPKLPDDSIDEESHILLEDSENLNARLRVSSVAREINQEMVRHVIALVKDSMKECQKTLRRARITLLGISRTKNERNSPKGTVQELAEMLEARGVKTSLYDPYVTESDLVEKSQHFAKNLTEAIEGVDVIVMTTGHEQFKRLNLKKLKAMMKAPAAIIDLENIFDPEEVEREGFIYRGLGRGVRQK